MILKKVKQPNSGVVISFTKYQEKRIVSAKHVCRGCGTAYQTNKGSRFCDTCKSYLVLWRKNQNAKKSLAVGGTNGHR